MGELKLNCLNSFGLVNIVYNRCKNNLKQGLARTLLSNFDIFYAKSLNKGNRRR